MLWISQPAAKESAVAALEWDGLHRRQSIARVPEVHAMFNPTTAYTTFKAGDWVVYRVSKYSAHPSRRALDVRPEPHGEMYSYEVEKHWAVEQVLPNGLLVVVTRRGKHRIVEGDDPRLRRARWWEILFLSRRFPESKRSDSVSSQARGVA